MGNIHHTFFFFKPVIGLTYGKHKDLTGEEARNLFPTCMNWFVAAS